MKKILLIFLLFFYAANDLKSQWVLGKEPTGDIVNCIGKIGYNILANTTQGFYVSSDYGKTWFLSGTGLPNNVYVKVYYQYGSDIYAATDGSGIYLSSDNGLSWSSRNNGLTTLSIYSLTANGTSLFAGTNNGVFISNNGGINWTLCNNVQLNNDVLSLCTKGNTIFAGMQTGGIYKSTNNGGTWTPCNNGLQGTSVASMVVYGNNILASVSNGVYLTTNNGSNWIFCSSDITGNFSEMHLLVDGSNIYVTSTSGVFISVNGGINWTAMGGSFNPGSIIAVNGVVYVGHPGAGVYKYNGAAWDYVNIISPVVTITSNGTTVFAGQFSYDGPFVSTDNGYSWNASYDGMNDLPVLSLLYYDNAVYAGTSLDGVYLSTDYGIHWMPINNGLTTLQIKTVINDGPVLYAGTYNGIYKSVNHGLSWTLQSNRGTDKLAISGSNFYVVGGGLYYSSNNGSSWISIDSGITHSPTVIDVHDSTLLVGTAGGGVFRSVDNGSTWLPSSSGLGAINQVREIIRHGSNIFLCATNVNAGDVFLSTDDGLTWSVISLTGVGIPYSIHASNSTLFAGLTRDAIAYRPLNDVINCLASINSLGSTSICPSASVLLYADTGTNFSYQWKLNGANISGANNSSYSASINGNYSCDVTMSCGTTRTNSISIGVNLPPSLLQSPFSSHICSGNTTSFHVVATGNALTYQWQDNGNYIVNDSVFSGANTSTLTLTNTPVNINQHQFTCVITDACMNSLTSTAAIITVDASISPSVTIAGPSVVCPSNATFIATPVNGGLNPGYIWKINGVAASMNDSSFSPSLLADGDIVTVTLTNNDSCVYPRTVTSSPIVINTFPVIIPVISNNAGQLTSTPAIGYQWYLNGGPISTANSQSYTPQLDGIYTVQITDSNGCQVTSGIYIVNNLVYSPNISSAGHWHSMYLCNDSTVNTWGRNDEYQLGDTLSADQFLPIQVPGLTGIVSVASKFKTSMALKSDSTVWYWGLLGSALPTQSTGLTSVTDIAAGNEHCMALRSDSTVWCWGYNTYGQLGNGNTLTNFTPAQVAGLTGVVDISGGDFHSLALKSDGTVWAWGNNNYGNLGDSTQIQRNFPVQVRNLSNVISISCGLYCSYALKSDGTIWAWGENHSGTIGDGTLITRFTPVQTVGLANMTAVVAGSYHALAIKSDSTVWSWGDNGNGQLGNGNQVDQLVAIQVQNIDSVVAVSAGGYHSLGLKEDGTLWSWGLNANGQLGNPSAIGIGFYPIQTIDLCNIGTGVDGIQSDGALLSVYPNPSNGKFTISRVNPKNETGSIIIYDVYGQIVNPETIMIDNISIELSAYAKGIYFAVLNVSGKISSIKLIVE